MSDQALSFFFNNIPVRGHICRLENSIADALNYHHEYPEFAKILLGEMAAVIQCFTMDIKDGDFHGTLQITGSGPIKMALVDVHLANQYRVCATFDDSAIIQKSTSLPAAFGNNSQLVLTIDIADNRYQTIVELAGKNLEETLQNYFIKSQQIPTIVLCKGSFKNGITTAGALILQKMPDQQSFDLVNSDDVWHELAILTSTLKDSELLNPDLPLKEILHRLYNQHDIIVSRETIPTFTCSCSLEKVQNVLNMLKTDEELPTQEIINCEFCGKTYHLDC